MIPLARPDLGDAEIAAAVAVLRSGNLVQGAEVARFEDGLAKYVGVRHVIVVSSGTAALHLAMVALDVGPGDEVIVPGFTFPATANVVELVGATPVLCDIDPATCNIAPEAIERLITPRTKVIMPVHEFGRPVDMDRIGAIAERHGVTLVEDAACAIGARWRGRACGSFGKLACFSFHPRKVLTTGEGGAIATNDDGLAERMRLLRNHGIHRTAAGIDFVCAGFNYRLTEIQAAIGTVQLARLDAMIARRRELAAAYRILLDGAGCLLPDDPLDGFVTYQTYHILAPSPESRRELLVRLQANDIGCGNGATDLASTTHHRRFVGSQSLPGAAQAFTCGLALPLWADMRQEDLVTVTSHVRAVLAQCAGKAVVSP